MIAISMQIISKTDSSIFSQHIPSCMFIVVVITHNASWHLSTDQL